MHPRLTLLFALSLTGCIRDDPNHCANQSEDGDAYCMARHELPYCSSCNANVDGCVDAVLSSIPSECRPNNVATVADDDTSADPTSMSMSMSDSIADDSATSTPGTSTTEPSDDSIDDGSSSSDGGELPRCGNGVKDTEDENCDGTDQPLTTCEEVGLVGGKNGNAIGCYPEGSVNECKYDLTNCANTEMCHNEVIEGNEQCEDGVPIEMTCAELSPNFIDGQPTCSECMFNTTSCTPCVPNGEMCTATSECCGSLLCLGNCIL